MKCAICALWKEKRLTEELKRRSTIGNVSGNPNLEKTVEEILREEKVPDAVASISVLRGNEGDTMEVSICSSHIQIPHKVLHDIINKGKWPE